MDIDLVMTGTNATDWEQSISTSATTQIPSTHILDWGAPGKDAFDNDVTHDDGEGKNRFFHCLVLTTATGAGITNAVTFTSKAADATIATAGTDHISFTMPALVAAGTHYVKKIPAEAIYRYRGATFTPSGAGAYAVGVCIWIDASHETTRYRP